MCGTWTDVSACQLFMTHPTRVTFTFGVYQSTVPSVSQCGSQYASLLLESSSNAPFSQSHRVQAPEPSFQDNQERIEWGWGTKFQQNMEPCLPWLTPGPCELQASLPHRRRCPF